MIRIQKMKFIILVKLRIVIRLTSQKCLYINIIEINILLSSSSLRKEKDGKDKVDRMGSKDSIEVLKMKLIYQMMIIYRKNGFQRNFK